MFGVMNFLPENIESDDDGPASNDCKAEIDDIVEIAVRGRKPVFQNAVHYDGFAHLRVLGKREFDANKQYVLLVTNGDAEKVMSTVRVNRSLAYDYDIERRFWDEDALVLSDYHIRRVITKQDGRFCDKCTEYNKDADVPKTHYYLCRACRENPWR